MDDNDYDISGMLDDEDKRRMAEIEEFLRTNRYDYFRNWPMQEDYRNLR